MRNKKVIISLMVILISIVTGIFIFTANPQMSKQDHMESLNQELEELRGSGVIATIGVGSASSLELAIKKAEMNARVELGRLLSGEETGVMETTITGSQSIKRVVLSSDGSVEVAVIVGIYPEN